MKKIMLLFCVLFLVACSNEELSYDGRILKIAVVGEIPKIENKKVHFEQLSLETFRKNTTNVAETYDAVMITPSKFEDASNDTYVETYQNSEMPIILFDSDKAHYPFTNGGLTYGTAHFDSLNNGSHTTVYLNKLNENRNDTWYFYLEDEKEINKLYTEVFQKIESL